MAISSNNIQVYTTLSKNWLLRLIRMQKRTIVHVPSRLT